MNKKYSIDQTNDQWSKGYITNNNFTYYSYTHNFSIQDFEKLYRH